MKKFFLPILISCAIAPAMAQNIADAGRFANSEIAGTARYRAMAGAFGALGGDATAMNDNPAGIAIFRGTNQLTFSPTLSSTRTNTKADISTMTKKTDFAVSNLAYIISIRPEGSDKLVNFNIGLGFNHSEGLSRKYQMNLMNPRSSFGKYVMTRANNALRATSDPRYPYYLNNHTTYEHPDYLASDDAWDNRDIPLIALMGYDSYAIDDRVNQQGEFEGVEAFDIANGLSAAQYMSVLEKNRKDEYNINISANWDDRFYAGLTLSIVDFNSTVISDFYEEYSNNDASYDEYFNDLETKGSGVNFKLGMIYKPTPEWRIGAAIHTPTWYDMKDYYNGAMKTDDPDCIDYSYASQYGAYEARYKYYSPWEYQFSTAYVFGQKAILSLEYDLKDFANSSYAANEGGKAEYRGQNNYISQYMQMQHTIKAGLEYRLSNEFSLRAGFANQTSPYKSELLNDDLGNTVWNERYNGNMYWGDDRTLMLDGSTKPNYSLLDGTQYICGGLGWAKGRWSIDFAVTDRIMNEKIAAFPTTAEVEFNPNWEAVLTGDCAQATIVDMKTHSLKYDLTIGYKF